MAATTLPSCSAKKLWAYYRGIIAAINSFKQPSCEVISVSGAKFYPETTCVPAINTGTGAESFHRGFHDVSVLEELNPWSVVLFAVPKKRTSYSKKRLRMTHKWLKPVRHYTFCSHCGGPKLLHVLCGNCFKETLRQTAEHRRNTRN